MAFEKTKQHISKHKIVYVAVGSALVAATITAIALSQAKQIVVTDAFNVSWKPTKINNITTILERRGHPGNMVRCNQTGELFASQGRAAAANGLSPTSVGRNLAGLTDSVKGLSFTHMGEAK